MVELEAPAAPSLVGRVLRSEVQENVSYALDRLIGEGGMGTAYIARRESPEGSAPVVVKVMRPGLGESALLAELVARKEAVALGRLNEALPPTPFVVRFVDAGSTRLYGEAPTPWTAIEYVHGGVEGTTLEARVTYCLHKTGYAFSAERAAHVVRCLAQGLAAIHSVSVIHRDLSPGNVLCCGFGETEIFKIADFGVARTLGVEGTFVGMNLGTLGYSAPEAAQRGAGPHTDVFSLAAIVYYLLTGQHYFEVETPQDAVRVFASEHRPSITDHATLSPELANRPDACRAIDDALARATSLSVAERPQTAPAFAATLLGALGEQEVAPRSSHQLLSAVLSSLAPNFTTEYSWTLRHRARDDVVVGSVAWDADGRALILSPRRAWFWNGQVFLDATRLLAMVPGEMTFTQRHEAGGWLVGGKTATLSVLDASGVADTLEAPAADLVFELAAGHLGTLLSAVGARPGEAPALWTSQARRWLDPVALPGVARVTTLERLDSLRWLLGGRLHEGGGFAALYSPLEARLEMLATPGLRAFLGGATAHERSKALMVGSGGVILTIDGDRRSAAVLPDEPDLTAAALDILGREWATSRGRIFGRDARQGDAWRLLWKDASWETPFVSVMADAGQILAMTADGGILEGRSRDESG